MLTQLPDDLVELVMLEAHSAAAACRMGQASAGLARTLRSDAFWRVLAHRLYGEHFWCVAMSRPAPSSKPLASWRGELMRIERFQETVLRLEGRRAPNEEFYRMWRAKDR